MATEPQKVPGAIVNHFTGETLVLDSAYFETQREAIRAFLASEPWTDEELAELRRQYPEQAWAFTHDVDGELRAAEERLQNGEHGRIYYSDDEFLAGLSDAHV